ncbi:ribose-5-phosphate isomerase RpiA [Candidatus Synechococcus calcipolaris G9]|uniref:Ribose-5-phosphate isomerase A n=1 Tax=Candidatus Synechococcus calcipolaris G9 TaxID=1497997 RepID=A0ABT6EXT1_9SYNE|nr:ribose-5-phosphate isomerase RpiA [Candidatus Synechococcus calcipolaris]MDG2990596.1 ribose-5-phosphate isomerase RpiA [Candidatus Synechococcus calcipolaris G9]
MSMSDAVKLMKQAVAKAAAERVKSGMVVGLGTGSTTAFVIQFLGDRLRSRELTDIRGIPTSFQASVLAKKYGIPLVTLDDVEHLDLAIDGADEVDPDKNLIKGGGAAHTREKIVDSLADEFIVVVDSSKLVDRLGSTFPVPIELLPLALSPVTRAVEKMGGQPNLRMGVKKDGPVITDQGNLVLDVTFDEIKDPASLEASLNNIPGVLENGLFVGVADIILVGELDGETPKVREIN